MRVLGRIRLSRSYEESTSAERQRETIERWAESNDHTVIGWAEDLDVSGAVDPFDTPSLGPWLAEDRLGEWDILCAWKLDRLARRAVPLHRLFGLCQEQSKTLVCVSDNIDLSHWVGRLIASVIAGVAEGELEAIRERTQASHRKLRETGRWPGGKPAYGYRAQERADAAGWELVPDEHSSKVLTRVINEVLAGSSVESIATELTAIGELSPSDYIRSRGGERIRGNPFRGQTILAMLRSQTLLGYVTHNGVTVRDDQGVPVRKGPPLVSRETFDQLQAVLLARSNTKTVNRSTKASPLLGVAVCYECGGLLHFRGPTVRGKRYRYYVCSTRCIPTSFPADDLEELVEELFLRQLGDVKVRERYFVRAEDHQTELDEAVRAVDELTPLAGTMTSATMRSRLTEQLRALDGRIAHLESLPVSESRWEYRETQQTYSEAWYSADNEGRRQLLLKSGITAAAKMVNRVPTVDMRYPEDILERMSA